MNKEKQILRLNFKAFDNKWMLDYAYQHIGGNFSPVEWKNNLLYFLIDWFSEKETLTVTTSGSTGQPKKTELSKKAMEAGAKTTIDFFGLKPGSKILICLPAQYIATKMMLVRGITGKLDVFAIPPSLFPVSTWTPPLDFAAFTPAQMSKLLQKEEGVDFVNGIKTIILGGSPVSSSLEEKIQSLKSSVWHTYGMTETMSHVALRKLNGVEKSSFFHPLPGVKITLNNKQCITITAPHLNLFNLQTNDLGVINPDGGFIIKGRRDNIINSGGVKLIPEEIENRISRYMEFPFYIGALPDEILGEKMVMFVEKEITKPADEEKKKIERLLHNHLNGIEIPKEIIFQKKFKRTESGKIIR